MMRLVLRSMFCRLSRLMNYLRRRIILLPDISKVFNDLMRVTGSGTSEKLHLLRLSLSIFLRRPKLSGRTSNFLLAERLSEMSSSILWILSLTLMMLFALRSKICRHFS